jgi:zinc transport system substrate-binding protein
MARSGRPWGLQPWHVLVIGLAALIGAALLTRDSGARLRQTGASTSRENLTIVCTFLPIYVFTLNVAHEIPKVSVELLINAGVGCPHDYSLRAEDLKRVAEADVIVTNGLDLDPFLKELKNAAPHAQLITISDDCDVIHETEEHDHHHREHDHEHGNEANPHVWVSPHEAIKQMRTLAAKLSHFDRGRAPAYQRNAEGFIARLQALDEQVAKSRPLLAGKKIVTFHDAFAYLARDLNLTVAATLTQDPEHAPSAREIAETVETIKNEGVTAIFYEPAYSAELARTVSRETGATLYALNPFNSMEGTPTLRSYEEVMSQNLATLEKALGGSK